MAIAFDNGDGTTGTTTVSLTQTFTPVGTPRAIISIVVATGETGDVISGITYGGVAMERVGYAVNASGETGACWVYFLGAGIPTGAQSIVPTVSSGTTAKAIRNYSFTAAKDCRLAGTKVGTVVSTSQANPSVTITGISGASEGFAGLFTGLDAPASVTAGSGFTKNGSIDQGTTSACMEYQTTPNASGNNVIAFTSAADDVAMVAGAFEEFDPSTLKVPCIFLNQAVNQASTY